MVDNLKLLEYEYARIGIDPELRRIYFAFQKEAMPGLLKFYRQEGKSKRKMLAAGKLYADYDWIAAIKDNDSKARKQFILEAVDTNDPNYTKYKYYVTIGYAWAPDRDFRDPSKFPEEPGVYRLKKDKEVVRIGEGNNIASRLNQHLKEYADQVDTYDFEIVPNDEERKIEQKRLLESYRASVGRLPKLNPIAN
jgi:hypothetical protein